MATRKNRSKFPTRIARMIRNAHAKGWSATKTTEHINDSTLANNLDVYYTVPQVAAKMAHFTMGR